jgi:hypothetical protein
MFFTSIRRKCCEAQLREVEEITEEVKTTSEWHRRMTHEGLNQKGQRYNLDHFVDGERFISTGHLASLGLKRERGRQRKSITTSDRHNATTAKQEMLECSSSTRNGKLPLLINCNLG